MACSWSAAFCGHEHGGVGVVARIVPAHRPFLPRDVCRPRFDVATFIANEDSLDCRGAPARGGTPPAALADCALLLHGIDPIPQRRCCAGGGRGHAGLDQRLSPQVARRARIWRPFLASIYDVLAPAEGLRPRSPDSCTVFGFWLFVRVGVYRRFVNGTASATRAPCGQSPYLATLYILRGHNG